MYDLPANGIISCACSFATTYYIVMAKLAVDSCDVIVGTLERGVFLSQSGRDCSGDSFGNSLESPLTYPQV